MDIKIKNANPASLGRMPNRTELSSMLAMESAMSFSISLKDGENGEVNIYTPDGVRVPNVVSCILIDEYAPLPLFHVKVKTVGLIDGEYKPTNIRVGAGCFIRINGKDYHVFKTFNSKFKVNKEQIEAFRVYANVKD